MKPFSYQFADYFVHIKRRSLYFSVGHHHRPLNLCVCSKQWCSGGGATGAIAPVPIFLSHLFLVNFAYILQKLTFEMVYVTILLINCT